VLRAIEIVMLALFAVAALGQVFGGSVEGRTPTGIA
jgi:hypothetical protein